MQCSISRSDLAPPRYVVGLIVGSLLALVTIGEGSPAVAAPVAGWMSFGVGSEDDAAVTPDLELESVRGGVFAQLGGGLDWRAPSHASAFVQGSWQRFFASSNRNLLAAAGGGGLRFDIDQAWDAHAAAGAFFLNDDARPEARMVGGNTEVTLRHRARRLDVELRGGWENRRYPQLELPDDHGVQGTHVESRAYAGPGITWRPRPDLIASAAATLASTNTRLSFYDSDEVSFWAALRCALSAHTRVLGRGFARRRHFDHRTIDLNRDSTWQFGLAAEWDVDEPRTLVLGWLATHYEDPTSFGETVHRFSVAMTWRLGTRSILTTTRVTRAMAHAGDIVRLQIRAPQAHAVTVAGDFNGWDRSASPLGARGNGWWEITLRLPAGTYQYVFFVDGKPAPLPPGTPTVDDGFGGRNGVLEVLP